MIQKKHSSLLLFIILFAIINFFTSCTKDDIDTNPSLRLEFSTDTVFFDTVFTTIGSVTQRLMVYNHSDSKINISSIELAGGEQSNYKINIDGTATASASDVGLEPHDSIFIFVKVTVDPNNQNTPLVVADSIRFLTNGNQQDVKLLAWGQDAFFHKSESLQGDVTWDSIKPHVVYGFLRVDTNASLTVLPGTKIYFHKGAYLAVSHGSTLKMMGSLEHPIRLQGDRMDPFYKDLPGQWGGIELERGSKDNVIDYAIIKNGLYGIFIDSISPPNPILNLHNTIIQNIQGTGIYAYSSDIVSTNCVIGDCEGAALYIDFGGNYDFRQLTIGNYWGSSVRVMPSVYISNYQFAQGGSKVSNPLTNGYFGNCIVYGNESEEITLDSLPGTLFNFRFDHCLLKSQKASGKPRYNDCIFNQDPKFVDVTIYNYQLDTLSPAIKKGIPMGVLKDINGVERGITPDLGAYQFVPR